MPSPSSEPPAPRPPSGSLYRRDGYAWAKQQAEALRRRDLEAIDWDNVIEEIEAVGRAERKPWVSNCAQALELMLAIEYVGSATPAILEDWETEIRAFRGAMADAIDASPSLQIERGKLLAMAWKIARREAVERLASYSAQALGMSIDPQLRANWRTDLPEECPYPVEDVAAYNPKRDKEPRDLVWPPPIAKRLNEALGRNYRYPGVDLDALGRVQL